MTTYNVADTTELLAAIAAASGGDNIVCANGTYSPGTISKTFGSNVTIEAANALGAKFNNCQVQGDYITFDGIDFHGILYAPVNVSLYIGASASYITVVRCRAGYIYGTSGANNITIKYCRITNQDVDYGITGKMGIQAAYASYWTIECNLFRGLTTPATDDHINIQSCTNMTVHNNTFYDGYTWYNPSTGQYNHIDHIQVYHAAGAQCDAITITDNWFYDDWTTQDAYAVTWSGVINANATNLTITGNIACSGTPNGIFITNPNATTVCSENLSVSWPLSNTVADQGGIIRLLGGGSATVNANTLVGYNNTGTSTPTNTVTMTRAQMEAGFAFNTGSGDGWDAIADYVPTPAGTADNDHAWQSRVEGIVAGTQDFYFPDGTLQIADATPAAPVITGTPSISGTENVGETLTATAASVTGVPTPVRTWQWYNSVSGAIAGATSSTYVLQSSDEGDTVYVIQTETNATDVDTAQSSNTGTIGAELSPPAVSVLSPADNATGVSVTVDFVVTFDQNVQFGSGNIELWRAGAARETWSVTGDVGTGPHTVSISGTQLTINTQNDMFVADYHIKIDPGAIENTSGSAFAGISDETTWNFTTGDPAGTGHPFITVGPTGGGALVLRNGLPIVTS